MDRQLRDCHKHLDIWCNPIETQVPRLSLTNSQRCKKLDQSDLFEA